MIFSENRYPLFGIMIEEAIRWTMVGWESTKEQYDANGEDCHFARGGVLDSCRHSPCRGGGVVRLVQCLHARLRVLHVRAMPRHDPRRRWLLCAQRLRLCDAL